MFWCFSYLETAIRKSLRIQIYSMVNFVPHFSNLHALKFLFSCVGPCLKMVCSRGLSLGIILGSVLGNEHIHLTALTLSRRDTLQLPLHTLPSKLRTTLMRVLVNHLCSEGASDIQVCEGSFSGKFKLPCHIPRASCCNLHLCIQLQQGVCI